MVTNIEQDECPRDRSATGLLLRQTLMGEEWQKEHAKAFQREKDLPQSSDNHCYSRTLTWEPAERNTLLPHWSQNKQAFSEHGLE